MASIWWILAGIALAGLGLTLLVLFAPLELRVSAEKRDKARIQIRIRWFWGLIDKDMAARKPKKKPPEKKEEPKESKVPDPAKIRQHVRTAQAVFETPGFTGSVERLLLRWWRAIDFDRFRVWGRFGTGDPADTGRMFGNIQAAMPPVYMAPRLEVELDPQFYETVLEGGAEIQFSSNLWRFTWPVLAFLVTRSSRNAYKSAREVRRAPA